MRNAEPLPQPPGLRELQGSGPIALFLDFDGTLVELAETPDGITVPPGLGRTLAALSDRFKGRLALVMGRGLDDIERHLGALAIARAGSHGSDCRTAEGAVLGLAPASLAPDVLDEIAAFASRQGFSLEEKPHGAALHYRHDAALEGAGMAFAQDLAERGKLAIKRGKCVIEFVAPGGDKGTAVEAFMQSAPFAGARPVFVGDDVTDEDGFAAATRLGGFGIVVGDRKDTQAQFRLANPQTVHEWLEL